MVDVLEKVEYRVLVPEGEYEVEQHPDAETPYGIIRFDESFFTKEDLKWLYENNITAKINIGSLIYNGVPWFCEGDIGEVYGCGYAELVNVDAHFYDDPTYGGNGSGPNGNLSYALTYLDGPCLYLKDSTITSCNLSVYIGHWMVTPWRRMPIVPKQQYPTNNSWTSVGHFFGDYDLKEFILDGIKMKVELNGTRYECEGWTASNDSVVCYGYGNPYFASEYVGSPIDAEDNGLNFAIMVALANDSNEPFDDAKLRISDAVGDCTFRSYIEIPYEPPVCPHCGATGYFSGYRCHYTNHLYGCGSSISSATERDLMTLVNECGATYETTESLWAYLRTREAPLTSDECMVIMDQVSSALMLTRDKLHTDPIYIYVNIGAFSEVARQWLWYGQNGKPAFASGNYPYAWLHISGAASRVNCAIDVCKGENGYPYLRFVDYNPDEPVYTIVYESEHGTAPDPVPYQLKTVLTMEHLPNLTADGYEHIAWRTHTYEDVIGGYEAYEYGPYLYAVWRKAEPNLNIGNIVVKGYLGYDSGGGGGYSYYSSNNSGIKLVPGKKYCIRTSSGYETTTCVDNTGLFGESFGGASIYTIGNLEIITCVDDFDTGENFCAISIVNDDADTFGFFDEDCGMYFAIYEAATSEPNTFFMLGWLTGRLLAGRLGAPEATYPGNDSEYALCPGCKTPGYLVGTACDECSSIYDRCPACGSFICIGEGDYIYSGMERVCSCGYRDDICYYDCPSCGENWFDADNDHICIKCGYQGDPCPCCGSLMKYEITGDFRCHKCGYNTIDETEGYYTSCPSCNTGFFDIPRGRCLKCGHESEVCGICNEAMENCSCAYCPDCGELVQNCSCEWCPDCGELVQNCSCEWCPDCGEMTSPNNNCTCEYCPDCGLPTQYCGCFLND